MILGSRFSAPEILQVSEYFCPAIGGVPLLRIQTETEGTVADRALKFEKISLVTIEVY